MTLGQRIQELRKQAGLSQEALGEALGVSRQAVSKWESDGGIPELDTLIAMSRLFGITVGQLLGVEPPEETEEPQQATSGFTEEQVEDILRRYVEETSRPKETPASRLARWEWLPAAAIVALTVIVVLFVRINSLRSTVRMLQSDVNSLESRVSNEMNNLSGTIRSSIYDILAEEAELLNTFEWTLEGFDLEKKTVTLSIHASLKEYKAGSTMQFILACTDEDQTVELVTSDFVSGPDFSAAVTVPMNYHTEVSIRLSDAEGNLQEQAVDTIYHLQAENMQVEAYNLRVPFALRISKFGAVSETAMAERADIDIYTNYPELFWPERAVLTAWVNDEEIFSEKLTITHSEDDLGLYLGSIPGTYHKVPLTEGDTFEIMLTVTDNLGRVKEFTESYKVEDGELEGAPLAAPAIEID